MQAAKHRYTALICFVFCVLCCETNLAQRTVGLLSISAQTKPGYVLFAPLFSKTTYLINRKGQAVHTWTSKYNPGQSVYLLDNGNLLRTGNDSSAYFFGGGGVIQLLDWNSKVLWQYKISDSLQRQHHDIYPMPNGNILVLVWEKISKQTAIKTGRDTALLAKSIWSEKIIEIKPIGNDGAEIVWQWRIWDHLIQNKDPALANFGAPGDFAGRLDVNYAAYALDDWLHFNSVAYNKERDEIIVSNRNLSEIYILDHSTNSEEAASSTGGKKGRGGDFLFRWGNAEAYGRGNKDDRIFFHQHSAHWIDASLKDAGKIMVFNNGAGRGEPDYSSVVIIAPPLNEDGTYVLEKFQSYAPIAADWTYQAKIPESFFSVNVSSAQRLSNGNTLICEGAQGRFFEIDANENIIWQYVNPIDDKGAILQGSLSEKNQVFRCTFFETSHPAFKNHPIKNKGVLEKVPASRPNKK